MNEVCGEANKRKTIMESLVDEMREEFKGHWKKRLTDADAEFDLQVKDCREIIRINLPTKLKNLNDYRGSYGLKHDFETYRERVMGNTSRVAYVSENSAIAAMALEGFQCEKIRGHYHFNYSRKELKLLIKKNLSVTL